jgi:hypothetical protein
MTGPGPDWNAKLDAYVSDQLFLADRALANGHLPEHDHRVYAATQARLERQSGSGSVVRTEYEYRYEPDFAYKHQKLFIEAQERGKLQTATPHAPAGYARLGGFEGAAERAGVGHGGMKY